MNDPFPGILMIETVVVAAGGTWPSPITAARVAAGVRPVAAPRIVGDRVLWLQGLPEEGGRMAVAASGLLDENHVPGVPWVLINGSAVDSATATDPPKLAAAIRAAH